MLKPAGSGRRREVALDVLGGDGREPGVGQHRRQPTPPGRLATRSIGPIRVRRGATGVSADDVDLVSDLGIGRLFDVLSDAVVIGDPASGVITHWNPAA